MKFMVMECHPGYAVVLDEEGRFRKVANMRYEVGQTVTDVTEVEVPQAAPVKRKAQRWIGTFAAAAACILMLLIPTALMPGKAHASVYVTINPEVRIDVDRRDTVVGLEGVNEDGKALIQGYSYRRKDLDTVIDQLVDRAIGMEFLHEGDRITLTLDTEDQDWVTSHSEPLVRQLDEYMKDKLSVIIELVCDGHGEANIPVGEGHYTHDDDPDDDPDDGPDDDHDDDHDDSPDDGPDDDLDDDHDDGPDDDHDDGPDDDHDDDHDDDLDDGPDEGHGGGHHGDWEDEEDPDEDEEDPDEDEEDPEEDEEDSDEDEEDPEEDEEDPEEDEEDPEKDEEDPDEDEEDPEENEEDSDEDEEDPEEDEEDPEEDEEDSDEDEEDPEEDEEDPEEDEEDSDEDEDDD